MKPDPKDVLIEQLRKRIKRQNCVIVGRRKQAREHKRFLKAYFELVQKEVDTFKREIAGMRGRVIKAFEEGVISKDVLE